MTLPAGVERRLRERHRATQQKGARIKRGAAIFDGLDYPRTWDRFIGQVEAKEQLQANVISALARDTRIEHTLLASGLQGIGKTTLAYILAHEVGAGLVQVSGPVTVDEARTVLTAMEDKDILFWDEIHLAVAGNRNRADWALPFFTDGVLMTAAGAEKMPDVAVVAATTDAGKLPMTLMSRFMVRPKIVNYTDDEARLIVRNLSMRMGISVNVEEEPLIARAANNNPRDMRMILTAVRDVSYTGQFDLQKAFKWAGLTYDGIPAVAQDMMLLLLAAKDHTASMESIQAQLGEPGPLRHFEQCLLQKGYLTVTGRGRVLTDEGLARAELLLDERHG